VISTTVARECMKTIYRLKDDRERIRQLQKASTDDGRTGLKKEKYLIGTEDWWRAISSGTIPVIRLSGRVCGYWPGQWGGGPASFRMQTSDGTTFSEHCYVEPEEAKILFPIGGAVTVEYVVQKLKHQWDGKSESKLLISLSVGEETTKCSWGTSATRALSRLLGIGRSVLGNADWMHPGRPR
jgi:hypothetical protein